MQFKCVIVSDNLLPYEQTQTKTRPTERHDTTFLQKFVMDPSAATRRQS